ncbi:phage tail spike protein [Streptococcus suis]|uniref:phage tail spike protein n=1 Tax=Streptococcus suis TaxID=1307 RepID=UPI0038B99CAC
MLYLLDKDVKTVKWNGIPLHEASSAIVKEEINGDFTLTVRYPITDTGIYQLIKEDMLIKTPTPVLGPQLFRIKKPVENDDSLDITAYHITDDVMQRSIKPVSVVGQGCAMALSQMVQNAKTDLGAFSFTSDIMDSRTFNTTETETLYSVLLDGKHSIVGTWEGELVRDNFAMSIKRSRGADRGVVITTHKNLKSYQRTKNSQSVVTRIHAKSTFKAEGAEEETTFTVTVDSPLIGNYPYINEKDYENNNAKTVDELRKWAEAKFKNEGIDKISDAIEIEAYELDGQAIHLGDTVNIKSKKHDVDLYKKAVAYEYNALTEEYISITFDDKPGVGGSVVSSGVSNAADVILSANKTAQEVAIERAIRNANQAFDAEFEKRVEEINDGIEESKAEAERYADAIKQEISTEINDLDTAMQAQAQEHDRQVADILSKTQSVEALANQAKSDAANAIARANQVKTEAITDARAQVATVSQALNTAKSELQTAIASADQKARDSQASATALRNDLNLQASKILAQAQAQTALTSRVTTVETLADGTRSTVAELSRTMNEATQTIASVTNRTRTVEDTLSQTRTQYEALTQTVNAQTGQIDSISRRTGTIETGLAGVQERFENLRIEDNLLLNSSFNENLDQWQGNGVTIVDGKARIIGEFNKTKLVYQSIKSQTANDDVNQVYIASISVKVTNFVAGSRNPYLAIYIDGRKNDSANTWFGSTYLTTSRLDTVNNRGIVQFTTTFKVNVPRSQIGALNFHVYARDFTGEVEFEKVSLRRGNINLGWRASPEDLRHEIATYVRNASENSAELSRQIQLVDGKAVDAKTYAQQTADAIKTRLESLEIYKNAEGDRAEQYLTASREETARQLTAERTAIATNYVAKSTYDENVRGTTLKLNDIKTTADTAKQNLATYQNTVDRKLTELTSTTQTLDGKINTASAKITQNANEISKRLTSTQVDKAITDKGYQTKSDVDNNITGRGYITNSALQPYALSTTVQNLVQETAGSFERQITETRGLIPTEVNQNLFDVVFSDLRATGGASFVQSDDGWIEVTIKNKWSGFHWYYSDDINPSKKQYVVSYEAYLVDTVAETARFESDFGSPDQLTLINKTPKRYTVVLNRPVNIFNYINFVCDSSETGKKFRIRNIKLEEGIVATPYIAPFPTTVLFNTVKDTVDAHKRLIGDGSSISQAIQSASKFERYISSGGDIYQAIETAKGLVTEVSGTNGLKTQVSQLKNSWAVKNLSSSGQIIQQINLAEDGFLVDAAKIRLKGETLADEIQAIDGKFGTLFVADGTFAKLNANVIDSQAITADKLKVDQAFFTKFMANDAYLKQLFTKSAFITQVQAVTMSASQISGGILTATNGAMQVNLNAGQIMYYTDQAALKRVLTGYPTQFVKFATGTVSGKGNAGVTVIGSNRWNSESSNDGGFVGIRAWNGANIDSLDLVGDEIRLASSAFDNPDGWDVKTLDSGLRIAPHNRAAERNSRIEVGDVWIMKGNGTYSSLRDILNAFNGNFSKGPNADSYTYYPNGF